MSVSYRVQTARVTGARHVRAGEMCQDAALCGVRGELAFYGLADGQSGARFGLEGAQAALTVIRDYIGRRGLTLLASYVYTDEIQYELAQLLRRELRRLSRLRGAAETDFGSTAVVFAVCRRTGRYMTVHLGDGAILGVKGEGAPQFISAPENGVTAQYTWLTTSDGALGHLRVAFGRSAPWRRVVLVTDGARALCCGRNIPLRARELLERGGAAEVLAAVRESRQEDDASCIVLDRAPLEENAPRKCAAPACEIASNLV